MDNDFDSLIAGGVRDTEAAGVALSIDAAQVTGATIIETPEINVKLRGRDQLVEELGDLIVDSAFGTDVAQPVARADGCRVWVLHGKGGTGKSTVAIEVATRAKKAGVRTWYLYGRPEAALRNGLQTVALQAGAPRAALNNEHPADVLWRHLNALAGRWLLVLDNIDDIAALQTGDRPLSDATGYLRRPSPYGFVLVTSRVGHPHHWGPWCHLERLGSLDCTSGGQVLMDRIARTLKERAAEVGSVRAARRLSDALGGLPLALKFAARAIERARGDDFGLPAPRTFDEYRAVIERDDTPEAIYDETVVDFDRRTAQSWNLALDVLEKQGNVNARSLLQLLASFGPAPIPYTLLLHIPILTQSSLFRGLTTTELRTAMEGLQAMDLVETTTADVRGHEVPLASLHPLVRRAHRINHAVVQEVQAYRELLAQLLNRIVDDYPIKLPSSWWALPSSWWAWSLVAAHSSSPFELEKSAGIAGMNSFNVVSLTKPAHQAGLYYQRTGFYAEAERLFRTVFEIRQKVLRDRDGRTLEVRNDLAGVLQDRGRPEDSINEYRAVLDIRMTDLGADAPETLATRHSIAEALRDQGDYKAAESESREIVEKRVAYYGEEHSDTLDSRQNLGLLLHLSGRYRESEQQFTLVLDAYHQDQETAPRRLAALHNLGRLQQDMGNYQRARDSLEEALRLRCASLGEAHRDTVATQHALAYLAYLTGSFEAADALYARVLDAQEKSPDMDPRGLPGTHHNIGLLRLAQGRLADSEQSLTTALQSRVSLLGDQHPDTLSTRRALADLARASNHFEAAEAALREILEIQSRRLGEHHPETVATRYKLGLTLQSRRRFAEADQLLDAVVTARTNSVGERHPETLAARSARAAVQHQLGRRDEAEIEFRTILEVQLESLEPTSSDVVATRSRLGILLLVRRDYSGAEEQYRKVLEARQTVSHGPDLDATRALTILGLIAEMRDADAGAT